MVYIEYLDVLAGKIESRMKKVDNYGPIGDVEVSGL